MTSEQGHHRLPEPYPGMQDATPNHDDPARTLAGLATDHAAPPTSLSALNSAAGEASSASGAAPENDSNSVLSHPPDADKSSSIPSKHYASDAESRLSIGHDTSVLVQEATETEPQHDKSLKSEVQYLAEHRESAYSREEPVPSRIRGASNADLDPSVDDHKVDPSDMAHAPTISHSPLKALKHEHSTHAHSPLRESSIPVQSTETPTPASVVPRKRPPPKSAGKKGTASSVRREPASKKRKTEPVPKRLETPSQKSKAGLTGAKKLTSTSATPSIRNASTPPRSVTSVDPEADEYSEAEEDDEDEGPADPDADLYCLCRKPDTGSFMIGCDGGCEDWFHGKCVGVAEKDKNLIDAYICPRCVEKGLGPTTWKRMCRRVGCRLPARTPGSDAAKKAKKTSKYCTDACGLQYFKDLVGKTRGTNERPKGKKSSADSDYLGPRGGALSAGELKTLLGVSCGVDQFKRLGEGILSPPTTPAPESRPPGDKTQPYSTFNPAEQERMSEIASQKDAARAKHNLLKDRLKFITMLKQAAANAASERHLKPKDFCGFDARLLWTDDEFAAWRTGDEASNALRTGILPASMTQYPTTDIDGDTGMTNGDDSGNNKVETGVCARKKCLRHHDWSKLALDEVRFEVSENSEVMRGLEREEKDMTQRAGLRARVLRAGVAGGEVVMHEDADEADVYGTDGDSVETKHNLPATAEQMIAEIASIAGTGTAE